MESLNFTRESHKEWFTDGVVKFDRIIPVSLSEDAHLIVVAYGSDSDLKIGYGSSGQAGYDPVHIITLSLWIWMEMASLQMAIPWAFRCPLVEFQ